MYNGQDFNEVHLSGNIIKVLWRQQQELLKKSPEYVTPIINNENPLDIQIDLEGPQATPDEGGIFRVKLLIPNDFPMVAPKGIFITKIFHPNISEKGDICVNTLKKDWNSRQWSLYNLFEVIKCLLIVPFPQSALNEEAGKLFMENYDEYFKLAKMYTKIYAMKNDNKNNNTVNFVENADNKKETNNNTNDDDIEMEDSCNSNSNDNFNICNSTQYIHRNNNKFESIGNIDFRRMTEIPKSNYSLNYNCDNETKNNVNCQSNIKNNNNINNNFGMNDNFINNMLMNANLFNYSQGNNNKYNDNLEIKHILSSKEKPNLSLLPLMNANQIKNNNNNFGYHRSLTYNNISQGNLNGHNNSQEINKWLMRI